MVFWTSGALKHNAMQHFCAGRGAKDGVQLHSRRYKRADFEAGRSQSSSRRQAPHNGAISERMAGLWD